MKKPFVIILAVFMLAVTGCKRNLDLLESKKAIAEYFELKDAHYVLNLSEKKALRLGINKENYLLIVEEVQQADSILQELLKDPDRRHFIITDPKTLEECTVEEFLNKYTEAAIMQ